MDCISATNLPRVKMLEDVSSSEEMLLVSSADLWLCPNAHSSHVHIVSVAVCRYTAQYSPLDAILLSDNTSLI